MTDSKSNINSDLVTNTQKDNLQELNSILEQCNINLYGTKLFLQETIKKLWTNSNIPYQLKMGLTQDDIQNRLRNLQTNHIDSALFKMKGVRMKRKSIKQPQYEGEKRTNLSPKQLRFCQEYLIDLNGANAAMMQG